MPWIHDIFAVNKFRAGRDDDHPGFPADHYLENTCCDERPHVIGADHVVLREEQLSGNDIFSHLSYVLPGMRGREDLDMFFIQLIDLFYHDNGVVSLRQGLSGIDP